MTEKADCTISRCPECKSILLPVDKFGRCTNSVWGKCSFERLLPLTAKERTANSRALWLYAFPVAIQVGAKAYRIDGLEGEWRKETGKPLRSMSTTFDIGGRHFARIPLEGDRVFGFTREGLVSESRADLFTHQ